MDLKMLWTRTRMFDWRGGYGGRYVAERGRGAYEQFVKPAFDELYIRRNATPTSSCRGVRRTPWLSISL